LIICTVKNNIFVYCVEYEAMVHILTSEKEKTLMKNKG